MCLNNLNSYPTTTIVCHGVIVSGSFWMPHFHWITYKLELVAMWAGAIFFITHRMMADLKELNIATEWIARRVYLFRFLSWTLIPSGTGRSRVSSGKVGVIQLRLHPWKQQTLWIQAELTCVQHRSASLQSESLLHVAKHSFATRFRGDWAHWPGFLLLIFSRNTQESSQERSLETDLKMRVYWIEVTNTLQTASAHRRSVSKFSLQGKRHWNI